MRRQRGLAEDSKGTGGFMEAILAIMVISMAFALVAVTVPRLGPSDRMDSGLMKEAERLRDRILATASTDGLTIEAGLLCELEDAGIELLDGQGMKAELRLLGGGDEVLSITSSGPKPGSLDERYVLREPVCYSLDGSLVRAAVLEVAVW